MKLIFYDTAVQIRSDSTGNNPCTSIVAMENHFDDFDSDETDADPHFTHSSEESSESSSSDLESAERTDNSIEVKNGRLKESVISL